MPPTSKCITTNEVLLQFLATGITSFGEDATPLTAPRLDSIKRCTAYMTSPDASRNTCKQRAQRQLRDIWGYSSELYILVALCIEHPTKLGLRSSDHMSALARWWKSTPHPYGLKATCTSYSHILPEKVTPSYNDGTSALTSALQKDTFIRYLEGSAVKSFVIIIPYDPFENPYIEMSRSESQNLICLHSNQHVKR
jgi:hypothetical protein